MELYGCKKGKIEIHLILNVCMGENLHIAIKQMLTNEELQSKANKKKKLVAIN